VNVSSCRVAADKNAEQRSALIKNGYQLPVPLMQVDPASGKLKGYSPSEMYEFHREMPDVYQTRFSVMHQTNKVRGLVNLVPVISFWSSIHNVIWFIVQSLLDSTARNLLNLLVEVKHCVYAVGEPTEVYLSLWSEKQRKFISYVGTLRII